MRERFVSGAQVVVAAWVIGGAAPTLATSTGITSVSGKSGIICNACHSGGTAPLVRFEGPTEAEPGALLTFRFTVTSQSANQRAAGLNVAASLGTLSSIAGQGTRLLAGEITHSAPKNNDDNGQASFDFSWRAPEAPGTYRLFGAGNSVNRNNAITGDAPAATTHDIVVGAAEATPTATPTSTPIEATPTEAPTATATATQVPTPARACPGDCGSDGEVTVDELISGVNIALGVAAIDVCPVFDINNDSEVTIDEVLQAVNSALFGCPA
jgi:hypothetical protein